MNKLFRNFLVFGIFAIIILVAVFYYQMIVKRKNSNPNNKAAVTQNEPLVKVTGAIPGKLADGITQDMIQESSPTIIQNYTATNKQGDTQSTVEYITKKTPSDNSQLYVKYLNNHDWKVDSQSLNRLPDGSIQILAAKKDQIFNILITRDSVNQRNIVDISLINKNTAK